MDEQLTYQYHAVARTPYDTIERNAIISFQSTQHIEKPSALTFRREIAEACRQQFDIEIADDEVARLAANFDVYTDEQFAPVREKLEAAAEKERQRQERQAEKDRRGTGKTGKTTGKKTASGTPRLTVQQLKKWLKWLVGAVVIIWFVSTQLKDCSLGSIAGQARDTIEEMTKTSSTKKKSTSTAKKKSTTAKKKSTTTKKKSTSTKKKSATTAKKSSSKAKKSTSTAKKKSATTKKSSSGNTKR